MVQCYLVNLNCKINRYEMCADIFPYLFIEKSLGRLIFPLAMSAAFLLSSAWKSDACWRPCRIQNCMFWKCQFYWRLSWILISNKIILGERRSTEGLWDSKSHSNFFSSIYKSNTLKEYLTIIVLITFTCSLIYLDFFPKSDNLI